MDSDAIICDKCYLEVFFGGYCPLEHIKKSASADICVKSYATFTVFQKVKSAIMSPVVKFRVSLSKIYLCAAPQPGSWPSGHSEASENYLK